MSEQKVVKLVTTHVLYEMKLKGEKIAMLTAYDFSLARILDEAGIDIILVGDSASNVMAGFETTLPIPLDNMIYHGGHWWSLICRLAPTRAIHARRWHQPFVL